MKVLIAVTHLLGTGHLARAALIARAFSGQGHDVTLVTGGTTVPRVETSGLRLTQLPALKSDGVNFSKLLDSEGRPADDTLFARRRDMAIATLFEVNPDVLITELFPFGRRNLQGEFLALLEAARGMERPPLVLSSVRDILAPPSKPERAAQTEARLKAYYDGVLVHSDPDVVPLSLSWPTTPEVEAYLIYTGFVAPPRAEPAADGLGNGDILVSAGGGDVGAHIFSTALQSAALTPEWRWRLLVGGQDPGKRCLNMSKGAPGNALIEPARPEFRGMLYNASASVSMCGYNTALDVLQAGTPAVWIPFDAGGEVEQGLRAKALADQSAMQIIPSEDLTPETLIPALQKVQSAPPRDPATLAFDGAERTVACVENIQEARR